MTLTEFLLARIDEDGRRLDAPAFMESDSTRGPGWGDRGDCPICGKYQFEGTESATEDAWYEHAEDTHRRSRVLAECEAKRLLVAEVLPMRPDYDPLYVQKVLALPYADHPDYDEAWGM
ncbi:DUF6221 family protein [Oerskovia enterophila]|uniref:DUF6221 family protein n=1 Tax=Oerskovia enterophila TaxID=43678 RepID=UPI003825AC6B